MSEPDKIFTIPFAEGGERSTIPTAPAEYGRASLLEGFPPETSTPPSQGGKAPARTDFNGILYGITKHLQWTQAGGQWTYSAELNYAPPSIVYYSGEFYKCVTENGVGTVGGIQAPTNTAYWKILVDKDIPGLMPAGGTQGQYLTKVSGADFDVQWSPLDLSDIEAEMALKANQTDLDVLSAIVSKINGVPTGTVLHFAAPVPPNGYLVADGSLLLQSDYPELYAVIGNEYGAAALGYFYLPDYRDYFLRGHNPNSGRVLGSGQGDAIRNIEGRIKHAHTWDGNNTGPFVSGPAADLSAPNGGGAGNGGYTTFDASRVVPTADENRPVNKTVLICIKY